MRSITLLATLALLAAALAPGATAVKVDGVDTSISDSDGDGLPEPSATVVTPPCAGLYPGVFVGADASALGQRVYLVAATAVCQHGLWFELDPNALEVFDGVHLTPIFGTFGTLAGVSD